MRILLILLLSTSLAYASPHFLCKRLHQKDLPETINLEKLPNTFRVYQLLTSGFTPKTKYMLLTKDLGSENRAVFECFANENGSLMCRINDTITPLESNLLLLDNFLPGQPVEYTLFSKNPPTELVIKVIPNPLTIRDKQNRKITMELIDRQRMIYTARLTNFEPNEEVEITFTALGGTSPATLSDSGTLTDIISHLDIPNKLGGNDSIIVKPRGAEPLVINYEWGLTDTSR